jgi:tetratricopeptide (TPR) repeat protein
LNMKKRFEERLAQANRLIDEGKLREGADFLLRATMYSDDSRMVADLHMQRAALFVQAGGIGAAITAYETAALAADDGTAPTFLASAYFEKAQLLAGLGQPEEAHKAFVNAGKLLEKDESGDAVAIEALTWLVKSKAQKISAYLGRRTKPAQMSASSNGSGAGLVLPGPEHSGSGSEFLADGLQTQVAEI